MGRTRTIANRIRSLVLVRDQPPSTAQSAVIIRSGVSRLFIWMGIALVVVGLVVGVGIAVAGIATDDPSLYSGLLLTVIFGVGGGLMHLAGKRSRVELYPDRLVWTPVFGGATTVPWSAVHQVLVPQIPRDGLSVKLWLRNGQQVEVTAIRMSSSSGAGAWADSRYLAAGEHLINAHKSWLRLNGPR